jgi:flagellin FlaB
MDERAQVRGGTLLMFVAMVAVAAIAAGVLLGGVDEIRQNAENETSQAYADISGGVAVINEVGRVNASDGTVGYVRLTVKLGPGTNRTNLSEATIRYEDDDVNRTLNWTAMTANGSNFSTAAPIDHDGSAPAMNAETDVLHIVVAVEEIRSGTDASSAGIAAGGNAVLTITTASGTQTISVLSAPQSLTEGDWVPL